MADDSGNQTAQKIQLLHFVRLGFEGWSPLPGRQGNAKVAFHAFPPPLSASQAFACLAKLAKRDRDNQRPLKPLKNRPGSWRAPHHCLSPLRPGVRTLRGTHVPSGARSYQTPAAPSISIAACLLE